MAENPALMTYDLQRFVDAQAPVFDQVLAELRAGDKRSHWMWFIFPQLRCLGRSATARHFGLEGLAEARAYAAHPLLGARLLQCSEILLGLEGRNAQQIFGSPDDLKLCSCMTLFERAAADSSPYGRVLDRYYGGRRDPLTLRELPPDTA
ncbi:DUF1810 domain-containing protein [Piscinibacter sakaiensis]|uniref:DUF1810 domain-containing protein n=1 Tax=Piscinibacter sakaiensis TaxID=1547922 RepID=UPI003AAB959D